MLSVIPGSDGCQITVALERPFQQQCSSSSPSLISLLHHGLWASWPPLTLNLEQATRTELIIASLALPPAFLLSLFIHSLSSPLNKHLLNTLNTGGTVQIPTWLISAPTHRGAHRRQWVFLCYNHLIIVTDDLLCGQPNELPPKVTNDLDSCSRYLESTQVFDFNKIYLHTATPNMCKANTQSYLVFKLILVIVSWRIVLLFPLFFKE